MKRVTIIGSPYFNPAVKAGRTATFSLVLNDEAPTDDVTVTISGSLSTNSGPLTFTTANWQTPQAVTITAVDDMNDDGREIDTLTITATGGGYNFSTTVSQRITDSACDWRILTPWPLMRSRHIQSGTDLATIRTELIAEVFNGAGLPSNDTPSAETIGYTGTMHQFSSSDLTGVSSIDKLTFVTVDRSAYDWRSEAYHIKRTGGASKICFVHTGHGSETLHSLMCQALIDAGYDVMYMAMPICFQNTEDNPTVTGTGVTGHNSILSGGLDNGTWNPLELFFGDKIQALNYLDSNYSYTHYGIAGCSGGGLTALWCGALDERFNVSINLRGTTLIAENDAAADSDYEQGGWMNFASQVYSAGFSGAQVLATYSATDYPDLILLATTNNRTHYAYHNLHDNCCHQGNGQAILAPIIGQYGSFNFTQDTDVAYATHGFNVPDRALVLTAMNTL